MMGAHLAQPRRIGFFLGFAKELNWISEPTLGSSIKIECNGRRTSLRQNPHVRGREGTRIPILRMAVV